MEQVERTPSLSPPRRGLYAFAAVAAGILLSDALPSVPAALWFAGACASLVAAAVTPRDAGRPLLAVAALLLGAGSMAAQVFSAPADRLAISQEAPVLVVRGTVLEQWPVAAVDEWERPPHEYGPRLRVDVSLDSVQAGVGWNPASGKVGVFVPASRLDSTLGRRVQVTGRFRPVEGPANPGQRDPRRWAAQAGRVGSLSVESVEAVEVLPDEPAVIDRARSGIASALRALRGRAAGALGAALGEASDEQGFQSRALLRAMIIGEEDHVLRPVSDDMSRLGIVHILSISGFHLVLVAAVVVFLIRLTGDRGVWEYALAAGAIGLYLLVVPAQAPVVRSGVMVLVLLITEAFGRRYDRLNVLAWTACVLALWRPLDVFSPGFQLSFGVTAALIWRAAAWKEGLTASGLLGMPGVKGRTRREPVTPGRWLTGQVTGLCTATAIAWIVSSAVVAYHVGVVSLLGVAAGVVLTVPSILAIGAGFLAMLLAAAWPAAAEPFGAVAVFFSDVTVVGSRLAAMFPASSMPLPQVPLAWTLATTAVAVAAIAPGGWRRAGTRLAALVCALWLAGVVLCAGLPISTPTVDRFALPGSSATLVRVADQAVLIDPGSGAKRTGAPTLRRAVAACGAWRVRTVVITGTQTERFDHLPELARSLGVDTVLLPPGFDATASARPEGDQARLLRRLRGLGIAVRTLDPAQALAIGDVSITVEGPAVVYLSRTGTPAKRFQLAPLERAEHVTLPP